VSDAARDRLDRLDRLADGLSALTARELAYVQVAARLERAATRRRSEIATNGRTGEPAGLGGAA
jgi:hypothetical protein